MLYFVDTEFVERGPKHPIELISIGVVAQDGREFYRCSLDFDPSHANDWVQTNVLPHLPARGDKRYWSDNASIADQLRVFIGTDKPQFWGYYADYDWVVTCQLFGAMIDLPHGWPMYCMDLKQWAKMLGNPRLPSQTRTEHDALNDARWNREAYYFLQRLSSASSAPVGEAS